MHTLCYIAMILCYRLKSVFTYSGDVSWRESEGACFCREREREREIWSRPCNKQSAFCSIILNLHVNLGWSSIWHSKLAGMNSSALQDVNCHNFTAHHLKLTWKSQSAWSNHLLPRNSQSPNSIMKWNHSHRLWSICIETEILCGKLITHRRWTCQYFD